MADATPTPDATVTLTAERVGKLWTFYAIPDAAHSNADRLELGGGPSGAGVMFPISQVEQFWQAQQG
jgi:hypothetical protein